MNDTEFLTEGWRDQSADPRLVDRVLRNLNQRERSQRKWFIALGFLATGGGAAATSAFFLFGATPLTLAQVIEAGSKVKSFTETNRRIMGDESKRGFSIIKKVSGDAVFTEFKQAAGAPDRGRDYGYGDSKETITFMGYVNTAFVDGPRDFGDRYREVPQISVLLKDFKASKVERDFEWEGRKVTRFTFKNKVHDYDIDQELLADPKTNLPLKFTSMRDNKSWGDEWTFDYRPVDRANLKPDLPKDAKVIDLGPERSRFVKAIEHSNAVVPMFLTSSLLETTLLVKAVGHYSNSFLQYEVKVHSAAGKSYTATGYTDPTYIRDLRFGSQRYWQLSLRDHQADMKGSGTFTAEDRLSGTVTVRFGKNQSKVITFKDVKGIDVGWVEAVVHPFMVPMAKIKLGYQKR